jgi:hypothetical protein
VRVRVWTMALSFSPVLQRGQGLRGRQHGQLVPAVARSRRRRRAIDLDAHVRQARAHLGPGAVRVGDQLPVGTGHFLGQRQIEVRALKHEVGARAGGGDGQAVIADLDLDDLGHAVLGALVELRRLEAARGIGDVGRRGPQALAEGLDAAAGAQRLDARRRAVGEVAAEVLRHPGGEGEDGRGARRPDAVPLLAARLSAGGDDQGHGGGAGHEQAAGQGRRHEGGFRRRRFGDA